MPVDLVKAAQKEISPAAVPAGRKKIAIGIAAIADLLQMGFFMEFLPGGLSLADDALDIVVAIALTATLGFRWRLLFALALELTPGVALFPSWTAFVMTLPTLAADERHLPDIVVQAEPSPARGLPPAK
jgi:hypothetical protein